MSREASTPKPMKQSSMLRQFALMYQQVEMSWHEDRLIALSGARSSSSRLYDGVTRLFLATKKNSSDNDRRHIYGLRSEGEIARKRQRAASLSSPTLSKEAGSEQPTPTPGATMTEVSDASPVGSPMVPPSGNNLRADDWNGTRSRAMSEVEIPFLDDRPHTHTVHVHCRTCHVTSVRVNGEVAEFRKVDPQALRLDSSGMEPDAADATLRSALIVSEEGELEIILPLSGYHAHARQACSGDDDANGAARVASALLPPCR